MDFTRDFNGFHNVFSLFSCTGGAAKCSAVGSHGRRMACGAGVEVCGVLTLETGEGSGNYRHPEPVVHGLWPQTENFGSSECDRPDSAANPRKIYPCRSAGHPNGTETLL